MTRNTGLRSQEKLLSSLEDEQEQRDNLELLQAGELCCERTTDEAKETADCGELSREDVHDTPRKACKIHEDAPPQL